MDEQGSGEVPRDANAYFQSIGIKPSYSEDLVEREDSTSAVSPAQKLINDALALEESDFPPEPALNLRPAPKDDLKPTVWRSTEERELGKDVDEGPFQVPIVDPDW